MTGGERERYILNVFARERERERTLECVRGLEIPAHVRILPGHQPLPRLPAVTRQSGGTSVVAAAWCTEGPSYVCVLLCTSARRV